jgi:hypothetical protein
MIPGQHVVVVSQSHCTLRERERGLELRDTIQVLMPGSTVLLVHLFRVPIEESTVAGQVLKTGTGAINIDACRVAHQSEADRASATPQGAATSRSGRLAGKSQGGGERTPYEHKQGAGRWPSNLLLVHHPECQELGTKKMKVPFGGMKPGVYARGTQFSYGVYSHAPNVIRYHEDGIEEMPSWQCHPSCPCGILDRQSGDRKSAGVYPTSYSRGGGYTHGDIGKGFQGPLYEDTGGASRFFPQFKDLSELLDWLVRLTNTSEAR